MLSALAVAPFALWKGDAPARIAGVVCALNSVTLPVSLIFLQKNFGEVVELTIDFLWAIGLLMLVVRYAHRWLGVTMLLQAVQFSLHAYYLVMDLPPDRLHAWINNLDTTGISLSITAGVILAWRRRQTLADEAAALEFRRNQRVSSAA